MIHRLELLRHAKSSWDDPGLPDRDRPLAPRGIKACARLRKHMRKSGLAPELVLCSSATRAVQTWDGIRGGLPAGTSVEIEDGLYTADAEGLGLSGDGGSDALHRMRAKYPTGGLASLAFRGEWRTLTRGAAHLECFVVPREL
jgi:phosphohistidine phosphatase